MIGYYILAIGIGLLLGVYIGCVIIDRLFSIKSKS